MDIDDVLCFVGLATLPSNYPSSNQLPTFYAAFTTFAACRVAGPLMSCVHTLNDGTGANVFTDASMDLSDCRPVFFFSIRPLIAYPFCAWL